MKPIDKESTVLKLNKRIIETKFVVIDSYNNYNNSLFKYIRIRIDKKCVR